MSRTLLALAALVALSGPVQAQKPFDDPVVERMRKDIFFLAGPECEGRGVETKGIQKAADHIAAAFQKAGLKPAMKDGTYFQPFDTLLDPAPTAGTLVFLEGDKKTPTKLGTDLAVMGFTRATMKASGGLVFAGYGITAPKLKYDDDEGLYVEGQVVVILRRTPRYGAKGDKRFDTTLPDGQDSSHAAFTAKIALAQTNKAAALIIVNDSTAATGNLDPLPVFREHLFGAPASKIPVFMVKRETVSDLFKGAGHKTLKELEAAINNQLKPQSFELKGVTADAVATIKRPAIPSKNVVGVLEGAGPLKDETVVIGAHYDHVGYGTRNSAGGATASGKVHYGADDNASGTTGVIELARRFGAMKDRQGRRIVFITFSGEEDGLQGSQFYCKEPLFPLNKTAAMINMDMIGRTKPVHVDWLGLFPKKDKLVVYGTGTGDGFEKLTEETAKKADFRLFKVAASAGNSDNHSFYLKKIPVLFLFTGLHGEYHRPTDTPETIDVPGMKRVADVVEQMALNLTTRETAPKYAVVTSGAPADPTRPAPPQPKGPTGPRLGILPNYAFEGTGVLLEGVVMGGAAEKAGLKDGDIIIEIAGVATPDLGTYMSAMGGQKLGTSINIVVERKGKKLTLKADLK